MKRQRMGNQFWLFVLLFATLSLAYPVTSAVSAPLETTTTVLTTATTNPTTIANITYAPFKALVTSSADPVAIKHRFKRRLRHLDVGPVWGYGLDFEAYQLVEDWNADTGLGARNARDFAGAGLTVAGSRSRKTNAFDGAMGPDRMNDHTHIEWVGMLAATSETPKINVTADLEAEIKRVRQEAETTIANLQLLADERGEQLEAVQGRLAAAETKAGDVTNDLVIAQNVIGEQQDIIRKQDEDARRLGDDLSNARQIIVDQQTTIDRQNKEAERMLEESLKLEAEMTWMGQRLAVQDEAALRMQDQMVKQMEEAKRVEADLLLALSSLRLQFSETARLLYTLLAAVSAAIIALVMYIFTRTPTLKIEERIVEKEVPVVQEVEKIVEKEVPVVQEVEKIVEKEVVREVEKIVEKIVEKEVPVEVIREVERIVEVEKIVDRPVEVIKEVFVDKPVEVIKEVVKIVEVEKKDNGAAKTKAPEPSQKPNSKQTKAPEPAQKPMSKQAKAPKPSQKPKSKHSGVSSKQKTAEVPAEPTKEDTTFITAMVKHVDRVKEVVKPVYILLPLPSRRTQVIDAESLHTPCPVGKERVNAGETTPQVLAVPSLLANISHNSVRAHDTPFAVAVTRGQTSNVWNERRIVTFLGPIILPPAMSVLNRSTVLALLGQWVEHGLIAVYLHAGQGERRNGRNERIGGDRARDLDSAERVQLLEDVSDVVPSVIEVITDAAGQTSPHDESEAAKPFEPAMDEESTATGDGPVADPDLTPAAAGLNIAAAAEETSPHDEPEAVASFERAVEEESTATGDGPVVDPDLTPAAADSTIAAAAEETSSHDESQAAESSECAVDEESTATGDGPVADPDHTPAADATGDGPVADPDHTPAAADPTIAAAAEETSSYDKSEAMKSFENTPDEESTATGDGPVADPDHVHPAEESSSPETPLKNVAGLASSSRESAPLPSLDQGPATPPAMPTGPTTASAGEQSGSNTQHEATTSRTIRPRDARKAETFAIMQEHRKNGTWESHKEEKRLKREKEAEEKRRAEEEEKAREARETREERARAPPATHSSRTQSQARASTATRQASPIPHGMAQSRAFAPSVAPAIASTVSITAAASRVPSFGQANAGRGRNGPPTSIASSDAPHRINSLATSIHAGSAASPKPANADRRRQGMRETTASTPQPSVNVPPAAQRTGGNPVSDTTPDPRHANNRRHGRKRGPKREA